MFEQAAPIAALLASCALLGLLIGRLIRGRRPRVEIERPRIAASTVFLRDAYNGAVSTHTRMRCAFDAVYLCCCELAEREGHRVNAEYPNDAVMRASLSALNATQEELQTVELLAAWVVDASPSLPAVSIEAACKLAERIRQETISVLS
jgi:hypothetical protein